MGPTPDDVQLAARGVQLGLYTGLDLQSCEAERLRLLSEGVALPIQRVLMDRGLVDEAAWERLTRPDAASQAPVAARIGAYEILCALAKGAAGQVFLAREPETGRQVAVKLLMPHASQNQRRRFARESELLAQLRHPNVVSIHAAGEHEGSPFLVMDLAPGASLQARIAREGRLPIREAAELTRVLADALEYVHGEGVLHRDLKPDNVLLAESGPLLTDFGLARELAATRSSLTQEGTALGTPGYWPPEQVVDSLGAPGPPSDVYGLGGTLYACLTGVPPIEAATMAEWVAATVRRRPTPLRKLRPEIDERLEAICHRCLEKKPSDRYPTAAALSEDLRAFLEDRPVARQRWRVAALAVVAVLALVVGLLRGREVAQARSTLRAQTLWIDSELRPFELGVLGTAPSATPGVLAARLATSQAAARVADPTPKQRRALEYLAASCSLVGDEAPPSGPTADRSAAQLVVDALRDWRGGRERQAQLRLTEALERDGAFLPAWLLEFQMRCTRDPQRFLEELAAIDPGPRRDAGLRVATPAFNAHASNALGRLASDRLAEGELRLAVQAGAAVGLTYSAADKRRCLEQSAPAWGEAFAAAIGRGEELALVRRLADACKLAPRVEPGPQLLAVLDDVLTALHVLARQAYEAGLPAQARRRVRALRCDALIFYEIAPGRLRHLGLHRVLDDLVLARRVPYTPEESRLIVATCLRYGGKYSAMSLTLRLIPAGRKAWEVWGALRPGSQVGLFARALHHQGAEALRLLLEVPRAPLADLSPRFHAEAVALLASHWLRSEDRPRPEVVVAALRAVRADAQLDLRSRYVAADYLSRVVGAQAPEPALESLAESIALLSRPVEGKPGANPAILSGGRSPADVARFAAGLRARRAEILFSMERAAAAQREAAEAVALLPLASVETPEGFKVRRVSAGIKRVLGDLDGAWEALRPFPAVNTGPEAYACELVRIAHARGDAELAREYLERARRTLPGPSAGLRRLAAELFPD